VNKVVVGWSLSLFIACGSELGAREGEQCGEAATCAAGLECYRGFCIPVETAPDASRDAQGAAGDGRTEIVSESTASSFDAGILSSLDAGPAPIPQAGRSAAESNGNDAGTTRDAGTPAQTSGSSSTSSPAVTSPLATTGDGAASPSTGGAPGAGTPNPKPIPQVSMPPTALDSGTTLDAAAPGPGVGANAPDAGMSVLDAGASVLDAGASVPDAAAAAPPDAGVKLPKDCTIQECCEELAKGEGKGGGKKCGCEDPALLRTLGCVVLAPIGVLL
jgi:hypothetical protein